MWLNKILAALLIGAIPIFLFRAILSQQQKHAIHETIQIVAKILLAGMMILAMILIYRRYF